MFAAFIPIVLIEAIILRRSLMLEFVAALKLSARINLISTIAGIPLAWLLMFLLELATGIPIGMWFDGHHASQLPDSIGALLSVTLWSAWVGPGNGSGYWMVPAASLSLLIPSFLISYWLEAMVAGTVLADRQRTLVRSAVLRANLATYAMLAVLVGAWLTYSIVTQ